MPAFKDITGERRGRLTATRYVGDSHWLCTCDCGTEVIIQTGGLNYGRSKSCGCLMREINSKRFTTHGKSKTPLYAVWSSMIARCENPKTRQWKDYGGRGIRVCQRWRESFQAFADDIGQRPDGLQIDRINNDGNYDPSNFRWATRSEQCLNRRPKSR